MAGNNGRKMTVDMDATTLVGVMEKGLSFSAEPVDVTTDDDGGYRTVLPEPGVRSIDATVSGITSDEVLIAEIAKTGTFALPALVINLATGDGATTPGKITGDFFLSSYEETGGHAGAVEFSATLISSGAYTYTATIA